MTVAPILPPNAQLPAPPASNEQLVGWARGLTKTVGDLYSMLARRADSVLTHGLAAELPAAQGSRRLFVATDTGEAHYDAGFDIPLVTRNADYLTVGTVRRPIADRGGQVYNVKAFGATGDGIADDTAAIYAALAAMPAATHGIGAAPLGVPMPMGTLYFPAGVYRISSALVFTDYHYITVAGDGWQSSIILADAAVPSAVTFDGNSTVNVLHGCALRDIAVMTSSASPAAIGVSLVNTDFFYMDRVAILNFTTSAITLDQVWESSFRDLYIASVGKAGTSSTAVIDYGGGSQHNNTTWSKVEFSSCYGTHIRIHSAGISENLMFDHIVAETDAGVGYANFAEPLISIIDSHGNIRFDHFYFSKNPISSGAGGGTMVSATGTSSFWKSGISFSQGMFAQGSAHAWTALSSFVDSNAELSFKDVTFLDPIAVVSPPFFAGTGHYSFSDCWVISYGGIQFLQLFSTPANFSGTCWWTSNYSDRVYHYFPPGSQFSAGLTLVNGSQNDVVLQPGNVQYLFGPTASATITGIAGGWDGREITLIKGFWQDLTLAHNNAGSVAGNRIVCPGPVDFVLGGGIYFQAVTLTYTMALGAWFIKSHT